jgi:SAM-dependent methyltransferase
MHPQNIQCSTTPCGLCAGTASREIETIDRHGDPLRVVVCCDCGVVRNDPVPSADDLRRFYSEEYRSSYKGTLEPRLRHAARYFKSAARHIQHQWASYEPVDSVLDIGSGSGEFLFLMRELGKSVMGLEPSLGYSEFCRRKLGLDIATGEIDSFSPPRSFDHIRLSHVVEHLRDPVEKLRRVSSWLREGGSIYVEVPDFGHYCATKTPGRVFHYGHIYNFDKDSFERLVSASGLRIVERTGPTAGFLTRTTAPHAPAPATPDQVDATVRMYEMHRRGGLRSKSRSSRLGDKVAKYWDEYRLVLAMRDHSTIGRSAARELGKQLPQRLAPC